jgi:hypothetical protein
VSSLLQHHGGHSKRGVELLMYLQREEPWIVGDLTLTRKVDSEPVRLTRPNGSTTTVPRLYRVFRKPAGMFGCWVVFRWNGKEHVPDLSVPIGVEKLPRDATPLSDSEAANYWFK